MEILSRWVIGFVFSLFIGHLLTKKFVNDLRSYIKFDMSGINVSKRGIPTWVMGTLERLFFTILIGFYVPAAGAAIMGWLTIKMLTNWNRINVRYGDPATGAVVDRIKIKEEANLRTYALSGLLGSLMSMLFALIGGLICKGAIWWWPH